MRGLTLKWARGSTWGAGRQERGIRLQQRYRGWARRWAWALGAGLTAWGLGVWLHAPTWLEHAQAKQDVAALQAQLAAVPTRQTTQQGVAADPALWPLPRPDQLGPMWTLLPSALAPYRVRLLTMQPVQEAMTASLPSQAMALRLQARFENWAGLWAVLAQMGPVWSMDRLRVVPSTGGEGVDIELVWRIWFRTEEATRPANGVASNGLAWALANPQGSEARGGMGGASVFESVRSPAEVKAVAEAKPLKEAAVVPGTLALPQDLVFANEPERWPVLPMRLVGILRHGQQVEAVLANDRHWWRAQVGRQISLEGHRVWRIGHDDLQVRDPQGRIQTLKMEARTP